MTGGPIFRPASGPSWLRPVLDSIERRSPDRCGAMVRKAADQTGANFTAIAALLWDEEVYADAAWHDPLVGSRLTVPAGVDRVRVGCTVSTNNVTSSVGQFLSVGKNGSASYDGFVVCNATSGPAAVGSPRMSIASGPIPVDAGDYFEAYLLVSADASIDIVAAQSNFWIERV